MKILLLGDASNFHNTLAGALRKLGHEVTLVSNGGGWLDTSRDIDLTRSPGGVGAVRYGARILSLLPKFRGYDVVQVVEPSFLHLRPGKLRPIFNFLRRHNGVVAYAAIGTDTNYVRACLDSKSFRYSDFRIGEEVSPFAAATPEAEINWLKPELVQYTDKFIADVDVIISDLYEYHKVYESVAPGKLFYGGIPIDTDALASAIRNVPEKVRFLVGIQSRRSVLKGTDVMLEVLKRIEAAHPECCEVVTATDVPYSDYIKLLSDCHLLVDQLYSYTPATNALLAMARGRIAVSGAEDEYLKFIGEENVPIINLDPTHPEEYEARIEWILNNRNLIPKMSQRSMEFVKRHNDSLLVAKRFLDAWSSVSPSKKSL